MCQHTLITYACGPGGIQGYHRHQDVLPCQRYQAQMAAYNADRSNSSSPPYCRNIKTTRQNRGHLCSYCEEDVLGRAVLAAPAAAATKTSTKPRKSSPRERSKTDEGLSRSNAVRISSPRQVAPVSDPAWNYMNIMPATSSSGCWSEATARAHHGASSRLQNGSYTYPQKSSCARQQLEQQYEAEVRFERERRGIQRAHERVLAETSVFDWDDEEDEDEDGPGFALALRGRAHLVKQNVKMRVCREAEKKVRTAKKVVETKASRDPVEMLRREREKPVKRAKKRSLCIVM